MTTVEDRLYRAIVTRYEGMGEAWTTDESGDTLARAAAEEAVREVGHMIHDLHLRGGRLRAGQPCPVCDVADVPPTTREQTLQEIARGLGPRAPLSLQQGAAWVRLSAWAARRLLEAVE